jgi:hypothetical protein
MTLSWFVQQFLAKTLSCPWNVGVTVRVNVCVCVTVVVLVGVTVCVTVGVGVGLGQQILLAQAFEEKEVLPQDVIVSSQVVLAEYPRNR